MGGRASLAAALLVLTTACSADPKATPQEPPTEAATHPVPGSIATADAQPAPLDWQPAGDSPTDRRVVGAEWTALIARGGGHVTLTRDGDEVVVRPGERRLVDELLMDDEWAVVVGWDDAGRSTPPATATVVDLATGETHPVDDPQPGPGSWAMHDGRVLYPAYDEDDRYCLAEADIATGSGDLTGFCAEPRHGFSNLSASEHGTALMTFDDRRPASCRTLGVLEGDSFAPLQDVPDCTGWDVALIGSGAVWSVVDDERRQDEGTFFARYRDEVVELGPGTTGTLTTCDDSAYFTSDPRKPGEPARLMRWRPDGILETVYESRGQGQAFLAPPECAGNVLTVSAFAEGGDEQVWARVP